MTFLLKRGWADQVLAIESVCLQNCLFIHISRVLGKCGGCIARGEDVSIFMDWHVLLVWQASILTLLMCCVFACLQDSLKFHSFKLLNVISRGFACWGVARRGSTCWDQLLPPQCTHYKRLTLTIIISSSMFTSPALPVELSRKIRCVCMYICMQSVQLRKRSWATPVVWCNLCAAAGHVATTCEGNGWGVPTRVRSHWTLGSTCSKWHWPVTDRTISQENT